MTIKKINYQHRRDFSAIMECEFCKATEVNNDGYDDENYHNNVIPNMKCKNCGKSSISGGAKVTPHIPKYPEGFQI